MSRVCTRVDWVRVFLCQLRVLSQHRHKEVCLLDSFYERKRSCKRQSATRRGHVVCDKSTRGQVELVTIRNNNKKEQGWHSRLVRGPDA